MSKTFEQRVTTVLAALRDGNSYSVSKISRLCISIATRAANLDVDMHAAGVAGLYAAIEHKDANGAAMLANSLGKHTRAKAFAEWVEGHSDILMTLDSKTGKWSAKLVPSEDRRERAVLVDLAITATASPFWTPPEKSSRDFSLAEALAMLMKRAETAKGKGKLSDADAAALVDIQSVLDKVAPAKPEAASADALEMVG